MKWFEILWPLILFAGYVGFNYLLKIASKEMKANEQPLTPEAKKQVEAFWTQKVQLEEALFPVEDEVHLVQGDSYQVQIEREQQRAAKAAQQLEALRVAKKSILIEKQKTSPVVVDVQSALKTPQQLKEAFVLREILSRPVACRNYRNRMDMR